MNLEELLEAADLTLPVQVSKQYSHADDAVLSVLTQDTGVEAVIYVEETADLIVALLNAAPALLSALTATRAERNEVRELAAKRESELIYLRAEADKLRAELATARADVATEALACPLDTPASGHHG